MFRYWEVWNFFFSITHLLVFFLGDEMSCFWSKIGRSCYLSSTSTFDLYLQYKSFCINSLVQVNLNFSAYALFGTLFCVSRRFFAFSQSFRDFHFLKIRLNKCIPGCIQGAFEASCACDSAQAVHRQGKTPLRGIRPRASSIERRQQMVFFASRQGVRGRAPPKRRRITTTNMEERCMTLIRIEGRCVATTSDAWRRRS